MSCINFFNKNITKSCLLNTLVRGCAVPVREYAVAPPPKDPRTHTGQKWDSNDYRMVRFLNAPKQINTQFAVDLIAQAPPIASTSRVICCDGGDDHLGHPRVYINLDKPGCHTCGYCGLRYYKK